LYYYNARYYDPSLGQFISPDTLVPDPSNVQAYNRYMYALGNPLRYNDPSGHAACAGVCTAPSSWQQVFEAIRALAASALAQAELIIAAQKKLAQALEQTLTSNKGMRS
jgi:uncharacterized protein RhaS with RHS repeats